MCATLKIKRESVPYMCSGSEGGVGVKQDGFLQKGSVKQGQSSKRRTMLSIKCR